MTPGGDKYVQLLDASASQSKRPLFGLSNEQLTDFLRAFEQPTYRAKQLAEALYRQWITDFDDISTLPKDLRQALIEAGFVVGLPEIAETFRSSDGTERYLVSCGDLQTVETVWMPGGD